MIRAFVAAKVCASEYMGATRTIKEKIAKIPGVLKVEIVFGRYDIIVEVKAKDLDELSRVVSDQIKSIPNILSTETLICCQL
jgi:Lrp/AsnC family transcriptional regulator for asnA, asnC and gidA